MITLGKCFKCNEIGHKSSNFPHKKTINMVDRDSTFEDKEDAFNDENEYSCKAKGGIEEYEVEEHVYVI